MGEADSSSPLDQSLNIFYLFFIFFLSKYLTKENTTLLVLL